MSRGSFEIEAITMDFQKNLNLPNISTNDVYYRRQLSFYSFNIHILSTGQSFFYCYTESVGKKGSDEVASLLHDFIFTKLDPSVKRLDIFCDSCGGQNKNYTIIRLLHYITATTKRLDFIKLTFPIRGHSYLECDRNMALINQHARAELPEDWITVFENARCKPSHFKVINVDTPLLRNWTTFLEPYYKKKCPFASRPIREIMFEKDHSRLVNFRTSYNGAWQTSAIKQPFENEQYTNVLKDGEFFLPEKLHEGNFFNNNEPELGKCFIKILILVKIKYLSSFAINKPWR